MTGSGVSPRKRRGSKEDQLTPIYSKYLIEGLAPRPSLNAFNLSSVSDFADGFGLSKILRIYQVAKELNDHGTVPSYHQQNLENRLVVWGKAYVKYCTKDGRRTRSEYEVTYRRNLCRRKYLEVYDKNTHLFLTFILALSPRACSDFTAIDDLLQRDEVQRCRLNLSLETKRLFDGIATRRGLANNPKHFAL
jgi:hypothetical protein